MHRLMALFLVGVVSSVASAQDSGVIRGIVINENDEPIVHARVHAEEEKPFFGHRIIRMFETDKRGEFEIRSLPWGNYAVFVGKQEDGYPDTDVAFYSNLSFPRCLIEPNLPVPYVTVKLGPKAGLLEINSVTNADTGDAVPNVSLTLRRAEKQNLFVTMTAVGPPPHLIPSGADVTVEISAPGYKSWILLGNDGNPEKVRLRPGEIRELNVQIRPEAR